MRDETEITRDIQRVVREKLDEHGIALKVVSAKSRIPYSTLCGYFPGRERGSTPRQPVELPLSAFRQLHGAIPECLLNLLIPEGWADVRVPVGVDFDEVDELCRDFSARKAAAHHPESEAGRDLGPSETNDLASNVVLLGRVA